MNAPLVHPPATIVPITVLPARDLGALRQRTEASPVVGWIVFALGVVLLAAWAVLSTLFTVDQLRRGTASTGTVVAAIAIIGVFFVPLGAVFAWKGWTGRIRRFDLHERGVAWEDHGGRLAYGWDEIRDVTWKELEHEADTGLGFGVSVRRTAELVLIPFRGTPITIDEKLPGHVELAAHVRDVAAEIMLPRYDAALAAGQRVLFGTVAVDGFGLHLTRATYPWESVSCILWESGGASAWYAVYNAHGQRVATVPTEGLTNQVIFEVVLGRFGKLVEGTGEASLGATIAAAAGKLLARFRR